MFDDYIWGKVQFIAGCIPQWFKADRQQFGLHVSFIDDVDDASFCEDNRKFKVINPKAVEEKRDSLFRDVEADGGEDCKFCWWRGGAYGYEFGVFFCVAKVNADIFHFEAVAVLIVLVLFLHDYLLQRILKKMVVEFQ